MKTKIIFALLTIVSVAAIGFYTLNKKTVNDIDEENETTDRIGEWIKREYKLLGTPVNHIIPADARMTEIKAAAKVPLKGMFARGETLNSYVSAGPNNYGGRSRVVKYDIRYNGTTNQVVLSGGVNGGIFKSTDGGNTWSWKATAGYNSVTTLAQDPRGAAINPITGKPYSDTWYAGTGEFIPSSYAVGSFIVGYGMFVSDDNGDTWTPLGFSNGTAPGSPANNIHLFDNAYDIINKIVIHPTTGALFVSRYAGVLKIIRNNTAYATNTAFTRTSVFAPYPANDLFTSNTSADIAIKTDGSKMFLSWQGSDTATASWNSGVLLKGVWESTTGDAGSWTKIADQSIYPAWDNPVSQGRIMLALAPSNQNLLYVLAQNQDTVTTPTPPEANLYKIDMSTGLPGSYGFTNLSANVPAGLQNFRGYQAQGGYNMAIAVKPDNPNFVIIGGTNAYSSTDGFSTTTNVNSIAGYQTTGQPGFTYPNTHPDIHYFEFQPGNPNIMLVASDGGISKTTNVTQSSPVYTLNNVNFQTYQFYYTAIDPDNTQNTFLGGAQDNSCVLRNGLSATPNDHFSFLEIIGGDGSSVGISNVIGGKKFLYLATQSGNIRRCQVSPADNSLIPNSMTSIKPTGATSDQIITYFHLNPDNTEDLYYTIFTGTSSNPNPKLYRTTSASTVTSGGWTDMTGVSSTIGLGTLIASLATTRGTYNTNHNLFIGTENGKLLRLKDPRNAAAASIPVDITPPGSRGGNFIDIAVNPRNDDTLMTVVSNYRYQSGTDINGNPVYADMPSIWVTGNANAATPTWTQVEGNIQPFSMRSCAIVVKQTGVEYYVGTSIGLYSTTLLNGTSTTWVKEGAGTPLENAIVSSLALRPSDNTLLVGTHGNGMYYTTIGSVATGINDPIRNDKNFIQNIWPTVTTDNIYVKKGNINTVQKLDIRIFGMNGQLLMRKEDSYRDLVIDTKKLAAGSYFISISSNDYKYQTVQYFIKPK